jgi:hypothetical protein
MSVTAQVRKAGLISAALAAAIGATVATTAPANAAPVSPRTAAVAAAPQAPAIVVPQTADGAVNWFANRQGSTAYEGYCEKAVRLAWNRVTHHPSAIEHWRSSDGARHTTGAAPRGAFVFWNISSYGHVGISDGNGGFWSTSVQGHIGHRDSIHYFSNYLGWKPGNSN